jgi:serine protease Do
MKYKKWIVLSLGLLVLFPLTAVAQNDTNEIELKKISKGFSNVAKKTIPAVVYIESQVTPGKKKEILKKKTPSENPFDSFQDDFFNRFFGFPNPDELEPRKQETVRGSGFYVTQDGYMMTNNHVVENATKIQVTLHNGKKVSAKVIGTDPKTDLAIIKVEEKTPVALSFADSDALEIGEWAIAVGNPFGLEASVTVGVVSAKGRNQLHITDFEDFIQTDAAINPGNSGGPLLDIDGNVIGINTAIVSGSGGYMGIGFAIPSNMAKRIMDQLIKCGSVTRGFLGVTLQPVDHDLAKFYKMEDLQGAMITDVVKGSPADVAGLKQEDIILTYNNVNVDSLSAFRNSVSLMAPGSKLALKVLREGKRLAIDVTVTAVPEEATPASSKVQKLGLKVQSLTQEIADQFGYGGEKGVVVSEVKEGTAAAMALIRPGSLIVAVNRKKVTNLEEFNKALAESEKEELVLLTIRQGEVSRFIALHFD